MARKLLTLLLSAALCLGITGLAVAGPGDFSELAEYEELTGKKLTFSEAPEFRVMVAAGELPPVEERLPEEPLVVTPVDEVGQYGGTLYMALLGPELWYPVTSSMYEPMLMLNRTSNKIIPNIAKGWKLSEDNKTFTLYLRKGMKWSDGAPFTADDIVFWWEDIMLNEELNPVKPERLVKVNKTDDWTVEYQFNESSLNYVNTLVSASGTGGGQGSVFAPAHALKEYHIKYNPEADALAQSEGYDHWWQLFSYKNVTVGAGNSPRRIGIPVLSPWVIEKRELGGVIFKRNPYYFKVDTAGNQLPYIDDIKATVIEDPEVRLMKVMSGEINYSANMLEGELAKYPTLMENREKGHYQVWLEMDPGRTEWASFVFNQNYEEDPALAKLLQNVKFRQALSLGINREQINTILFFGKARATQATTAPTDRWYEERWSKAYAEYDPQEASRMLDEIGLDKRDKDGYRLRSDGETLVLTVYFWDALKFWEEVAELAKTYWKDIGVKVHLKVMPDSVWSAGEFPVLVGYNWGVNEFSLPLNNGWWFGGTGTLFWAPKWLAWWNTRGQEEPAGQEPPEKIKKLFAMGDEFRSADEERAYEIAKYIFNWQAENLYSIGTIGDMPSPAIAAANMRNIDKAGNYEAAYGGMTIPSMKFLLPEQLYFEK